MNVTGRFLFEVSKKQNRLRGDRAERAVEDTDENHRNGRGAMGDHGREEGHSGEKQTGGVAALSVRD